MADVERFREHLFQAPGVVDPYKVHHVLNDGGHGQKVDFDAIPITDFLFDEWVEVCVEAIDRVYPASEIGSIILLSVAGGTNRLVEPVAEMLGTRATPALTKKVRGNDKRVEITDEARDLIATHPELVLALEDAATTGGMASTAVLSARSAGAKRVEVMNTLQRSEKLEKLAATRVVYTSIIYSPMPTYSREECQKNGFCADGWKLIPKGQ